MHRALLAVLLTAAASAQPAGTTAERLDAAVRAYHDAGQFEGVVLVVEGAPDAPRVLYEGAFGQADRAWGIPMEPDVRFPFASVTKQVAAVLAHLLEMDGRLDLDASVSRYVPGLVPSDAVLVRHLLDHTSGLPDINERQDEAWACGLLNVEDDSLSGPADLVRRFAGGPLRTTPGETVAYSNTDTLVLQAVMEAVTGQSFEALVRSRVLDPLGMETAGVFRQGAVVPRLAESYEGDRPAGCFARWRLGAAAAMYGTAADLARFDLALMAGDLLPPERLETLWASTAERGWVAQGAWAYPKAVGGGSVFVVERQGRFDPQWALNVLLPESGRAVVILKNAGDASLSGLAWQPGLPDDLVRVLSGEPPTGPARDD